MSTAAQLIGSTTVAGVLGLIAGFSLGVRAIRVLTCRTCANRRPNKEREGEGVR